MKWTDLHTSTEALTGEQSLIETYDWTPCWSLDDNNDDNNSNNDSENNNNNIDNNNKNNSNYKK